MTGIQKITLQGITGFPNYKQENLSRFRLILGTCAELQNYTKNENCETHEKSVAMFPYIIVKTNVWQQYFTPKFYTQNEDNFEYFNTFYENGFVNQSMQENQISMSYINIKYKQGIGIGAIGTQKLNVVSVIQSAFASFQIDNIKNITSDGSLITYTFSPNIKMSEFTFTRANIMAILGSIGGFMYTIKNLGNAVNKNANKIQMDNSMISRLYSVDREEQKHSCDVAHDDLDHSKTGKQELIDVFEARDRWQYKWRDTCCPLKGSGFSLRVCCCKRTTIKDKLFAKGRKKLFSEIDILRIVKQQRINQFATDLIMTQDQKNLVRWFDRYKLYFSSEEEEETIDSDQNQETPLIEDQDMKFGKDSSILRMSTLQKSHKEKCDFYDRHHLFVTDEARKEAKEIIDLFNCENSRIDQHILTKVLGLEDYTLIQEQLGLESDALEDNPKENLLNKNNQYLNYGINSQANPQKQESEFKIIKRLNTPNNREMLTPKRIFQKKEKDRNDSLNV